MRNLVAAVAVVVIFAAGSAHAAPITYTLSGTFDVTVNGTEYDNLDITFTGIGDTGTVGTTDFGATTPDVKLSSLTASVQGYSDVALPQSFDFFSNNGGGTQGFNIVGSYDFLDFSALTSYDAVSSVSPTSATFFYGGTITTPYGDGQVLNASDLTFTAVATDVSGAPEPAAWTMLLVGFLGLGAVVRRRAEAMA